MEDLDRLDIMDKLTDRPKRKKKVDDNLPAFLAGGGKLNARDEDLVRDAIERVFAEYEEETQEEPL